MFTLTLCWWSDAEYGWMGGFEQQIHELPLNWPDSHLQAIAFAIVLFYNQLA